MFFFSFAQAQACGTLIIPTGLGVTSSADVTSLNPLLVDSLYNQQAASLMYLGLIWVDGNTSRIDWGRSLASAINSPDGGVTYEVTLRPWHWSDGVPVTADDVAYTFSLIKALGTNYVGYGAGGMPGIIKSFTVLSPSQFRVVLTHKVNPLWFTYNGLGQLLPLPAHSWGRHSLDEIWQDQSSPGFFNVVDGPLMAQRLDIGLDLIMVPNPRFEGRKPQFQRLIFKFLEGDGAAVEGFESGDLDMANVPDALWGAVKDLPGARLVSVAPMQGFNEIALNFRDPAVAFFRDVRVRDAMADAIDQREMLKLVAHGSGEAVYGPIAPIAAAFLSPAMREQKYPVGFDPAKSRALLRQAGYVAGADGVLEKDGQRLSFTFLMLTGDAAIAQETEILQADFRSIGIEMKVREIEFNQLLSLLNDPASHWEAAGIGETLAAYPSGESLFATGAFQNLGGYSDARMDALIARSTNQPGLDGLYAYEDYASAQQPVIFFGVAAVSLLVHRNILGADKFVDAMGQYYPDALSCAP